MRSCRKIGAALRISRADEYNYILDRGGMLWNFDTYKIVAGEKDQLLNSSLVLY